MKPAQEPTAGQLAAAALAFARDHLGPRSEAHLADPGVETLVVARVRSGLALEDAVLRAVHEVARDHREIADEFLAYFLVDLLRVGRSYLTPGLRRYLDSGDLAQSVLGDLWTKLAATRFESRARFLALLREMICHKAIDHDRRRKTGRRREDLRVHEAPEDLRLASTDATPSVRAMVEEDRDRLALVLMRLAERDRLLLKGYLKGRSLSDMARELSLGDDAARMALQRAIHRARREVVRDWSRSSCEAAAPDEESGS